eukprot:TRINITY_DN75828_c0_g1_i1.p1 TRINITY_DN75828_c0_g1~~TRINITY_DN75828_c0_g1_i1.p1  ORF type:complete len:271 (+),score=50.25 TRINITY_DN75828_c0_g1_i1:42-815(+)
MAKGGKQADLTISLLATFHAEALDVLASKTIMPVKTFNEGTVNLKHLMPKRLVGKMRELDLAFKIARHLTSAYLDKTLAELTSVDVLAKVKQEVPHNDASDTIIDTNQMTLQTSFARAKKRGGEDKVAASIQRCFRRFLLRKKIVREQTLEIRRLLGESAARLAEMTSVISAVTVKQEGFHNDASDSILDTHRMTLQTFLARAKSKRNEVGDGKQQSDGKSQLPEKGKPFYVQGGNICLRSTKACRTTRRRSVSRTS